jgi:hypothetical protein
MLMRREIVGATLSVALLTGCTQEIPGLPEFAGENEGEVSVAGLPEMLPPEVAAQRERVVNIIGRGYNENSGQFEQTTNGSGVQFDTKHVLTVGHVAVSKEGALSADCDNMFVNATTKEPRSYYVSANKLLGTAADVESARGKDDIGKTNYDAAWLTLETSKGNSLDPREALTVRRTPLEKGEQLFIMGFGFDDSARPETHRNPNQVALEHGKMSLRQSTPRVIGAIVAGPHIENGQLAVLTGLEDYSKLPDADAVNRTGDSGGPAFDANGELVGVVSQGTTTTGTSEQQKEAAQAQTGVAIIDAPEGYDYSLTLLQPVTPEVIADLQNMPDASCVPAPAGK